MPTMYTGIEHAMVVRADGAHMVCLATNDCVAPPLRVDLCECVIELSTGLSSVAPPVLLLRFYENIS